MASKLTEVYTVVPGHNVAVLVGNYEFFKTRERENIPESSRGLHDATQELIEFWEKEEGERIGLPPGATKGLHLLSSNDPSHVFRLINRPEVILALRQPDSFVSAILHEETKRCQTAWITRPDRNSNRLNYVFII